MGSFPETYIDANTPSRFMLYKQGNLRHLFLCIVLAFFTLIGDTNLELEKIYHYKLIKIRTTILSTVIYMYS